MTFDDVVFDAMVELGPLFEGTRSQRGKQTITATLGADYKAWKATVSMGGETETSRTLEAVARPRVDARTLARYLGSVGACWIVDDFHKLATTEKQKLAQVMKAFMDMARAHPTLKVIAIGAVDSAREVVELDDNLWNRVIEIQVPLMSDSEIEKLMDRGGRALNVSFSDRTKDSVKYYSNGLASVAHQLCLNACISAGVENTLAESIQIGSAEFEPALEEYVEESSDTLKAAFDKALSSKRMRKFNNGEIIVKALIQFGQEGATHAQLLAKIHEAHSDYPASNLSIYLDKLQLDERGAILRFDHASRRYSYVEPIFRAYALSRFGTAPITTRRGSRTISTDFADIYKILTEMYVEAARED